MKTFALFALPALLALSSAAPAQLEPRQYSSSFTENQLTDGTPCREITIIFARGTFEFGNVGYYAGPPFFQAVANNVTSSNVAVQGVDYPANVQGFYAGGDTNGAATMSGLVGTAISNCPNTKLVLSGYSQGAQVTHLAAAELTASQTDFVNSVVLFGDPDDGKPVGSIPASKVITFCHSGDDICQGGVTIGEEHLNYGNDAAAAAAFVVARAES